MWYSAGQLEIARYSGTIAPEANLHKQKPLAQHIDTSCTMVTPQAREAQPGSVPRNGNDGGVATSLVDLPIT